MKEELEKYGDYKCELKNLKRELRKEENREVKISGSNFAVNGDIRPKGYMSNNSENQIINKNDKIAEIKEKISDLEERIEIIDLALKTLKNNDRIAVEMRYFDKVSFDAIASTFGLSTYKEAEQKVRNAVAKLDKICKIQ